MGILVALFFLNLVSCVEIERFKSPPWPRIPGGSGGLPWDASLITLSLSGPYPLSAPILSSPFVSAHTVLPTTSVPQLAPCLINSDRRASGCPRTPSRHPSPSDPDPRPLGDCHFRCDPAASPPRAPTGELDAPVVNIRRGHWTLGSQLGPSLQSRFSGWQSPRSCVPTCLYTRKIF